MAVTCTHAMGKQDAKTCCMQKELQHKNTSLASHLRDARKLWSAQIEECTTPDRRRSAPPLVPLQSVPMPHVLSHSFLVLQLIFGLELLALTTAHMR